MLEVNILNNDLLPISSDSSNVKEVEKSDLDFSSILKGIKERNGVEGRYNNNSKKDSTKKEVAVEVGIYIQVLDELLDKFSYLIQLFMENTENKGHIEEVHNFNLYNTLEKLVEFTEMLKEMPANYELLGFSEKDIELIKDMTGQALEKINTEGIESSSFNNEITKAMKKIEEVLKNGLDFKTNSNEDAEETEITDVKATIHENNVNILEDELEYEDLIAEKTEEDNPIEIRVDFDTSTPTKNDGLQNANHTEFNLNLFTNETITTDNKAEISFAQELNNEELIQQIVEKVEIREGIDKQEIKIKLKPDYLGNLILKLASKEGLVEAKIYTDNYHTKEIIESGLVQLKEQFKENGIEIKTFEVLVGSGNDFEKEGGNRFSFRNNKVKLKRVGKTDEEIKIYDNSFINQSPVIYEGKLNLFA